MGAKQFLLDYMPRSRPGFAVFTGGTNVPLNAVQDGRDSLNSMHPIANILGTINDDWAHDQQPQHVTAGVISGATVGFVSLSLNIVIAVWLCLRWRRKSKSRRASTIAFRDLEAEDDVLSVVGAGRGLVHLNLRKSSIAVPPPLLTCNNGPKGVVCRPLNQGKHKPIPRDAGSGRVLRPGIQDDDKCLFNMPIYDEPKETTVGCPRTLADRTEREQQKAILMVDSKSLRVNL
jgi:hypothetical protein